MSRKLYASPFSFLYKNLLFYKSKLKLFRAQALLYSCTSKIDSGFRYHEYLCCLVCIYVYISRTKLPIRANILRSICSEFLFLLLRVSSLLTCLQSDVIGKRVAFPQSYHAASEICVTYIRYSFSEHHRWLLYRRKNVRRISGDDSLSSNY